MSQLLGAQLDDLAALATQLDHTTAAIGSCRGDAVTSTSAVVESVRASAADALARVRAATESLRVSVTDAGSRTTAAAWTGANAERFRGAYAEFDASMARAEASTTATFEEFRVAIDRMAASLDDYGRELVAALQRAEMSTSSMGAAVRAQHANLDAVMNTGLSVG
jgi:hypothetical protein